MASEVGLWIDHRKAVVVTIENEVDVTREIRSNLEKDVRFSGRSGSKSPKVSRGSNAEDVQDRKFGNHLGSYYDGVISMIREADSIWIFGPGEAKVEFKDRLEHAALGDRIAGVDSVDKLTDLQIAARVRDYFLG